VTLERAISLDISSKGTIEVTLFYCWVRVTSNDFLESWTTMSWLSLDFFCKLYNFKVICLSRVILTTSILRIEAT
jgi:hypothetical protein